MFDKLPLILLIAAICVLMIYPYIGAGILLAAVCCRAGYYGLAAVSFAVCFALHFVMKKRIRPVKGAVPPSRAERKRKAKKAKGDPDGQ